jgi:hypothetical protein
MSAMPLAITNDTAEIPTSIRSIDSYLSLNSTDTWTTTSTGAP